MKMAVKLPTKGSSNKIRPGPHKRALESVPGEERREATGHNGMLRMSNARVFGDPMPTIGQVVLGGAGSLIALGGLYDVMMPRLPANLAAICGADSRSSKLVRELLRALGGALVGIGVAVVVLANGFDRESRERTTVLILLLVFPSEGMNTLGMLRVGSPYYVPLALIVLTLVGLAILWSSL
jgi:hypothetical protein